MLTSLGRGAFGKNWITSAGNQSASWLRRGEGRRLIRMACRSRSNFSNSVLKRPPTVSSVRPRPKSTLKPSSIAPYISSSMVLKEAMSVPCEYELRFLTARSAISSSVRLGWLGSVPLKNGSWPGNWLLLSLTNSLPGLTVIFDLGSSLSITHID